MSEELKFSKEDDKAVKWCEDNYKELTDEYKRIMMVKHYIT